MKNKILRLIPFFLLTFSFNSFANTQCGDLPEDTVALISQQSECSKAAEMAEYCAWGSSVDVQFVSAAQKVCLKNKNNWSLKHQFILETLSSDCLAKYSGLDGTMYLSAGYYCQLEVSQLLERMNQEPN